MQANQCANGGAGCTGDSVPQNIVSMLQTNLKTNVLKVDGQEERLLQLTVLLLHQPCNIGGPRIASGVQQKSV